MKKNLFAFLFATVCAGHTLSVSAQRAAPAPDTTGLAALKATVESHPSDLAAHQDFIRTMGLTDPGLEPQYEKWMKQFPGIAAIPFSLGHAYCNHEDPGA